MKRLWHVEDGYIEEPPVSRWLFGSVQAAPIWLVARLWLGYEWLHSGWERVFGEGSDAWMNGGVALESFANGAIAASEEPGHPQVAYGWWVESWKSPGTTPRGWPRSLP